MSQKKLNLDFSKNVEKINSRLLTLTYGSLIVRLIKDYEKPEEINDQLEKMGYNIGIRIIDDFLAKFLKPMPKTFDETVKIIAKEAFKYYLNIDAKYQSLKNKDGLGESSQEYRIIFNDNPLNDFVELPEKYQSLWYSNILCGIIRGAYETLNIKVECRYNQDTLKKNKTNEIIIKLIEIIEEKLQEEEE
jgi:hypothetical protein